MPCEIMIRAYTNGDGTVNYSHPDPIKDARGVYKPGYPCKIKDQPCIWGQKQRLPYNVRIIVTDASKDEVNSYIDTTYDIPHIHAAWERKLLFVQEASVPSIDGFRYTVSCSNPGFSNLAGITRDMVENYLNNWNGFVVSAATNSVTFDFAIYEDDRVPESIIKGALQSWGFWTTNISQAIFSEILYTQATGQHIVEVDYSAYIAASIPNKVENLILQRGGVIQIHDTGTRVVRFSINRTNVFQYFKQTIDRKLATRIYRTQLRISEATLDNIIADTSIDPAGGVKEVTFVQLQSYLLNRLDEDL